MAKNWFEVKNKGGVLDVSIHEEIGLFGVSAKDFIEEINVEAGIINVSIHSPGGSAFDGLAIYNALKKHSATVNTNIVGVAASAASTVFMAGDNRTMPEDAFIMIHQPLSGAFGIAEEMREMADFLDKMSETIVNIYVKNSNLDSEAINEMMSAGIGNNGTWITGAEALEMGFVDSVFEAKVAALSTNFTNHFKNTPESLSKQNYKEIENIDSIKSLELYLRESGISKGASTAFISRAKGILRSESVNNDEANNIINLFDNFEFKNIGENP